MQEENIEVPAEETPVETPETPEVVPPVEEPAAPAEPELYELPDGRKVDAVTLTKEWKENFLPEFTHKSQELAKIKSGESEKLPEQKSPLQDPSYVPGTYGELADIIQQNTIKAIEDRDRQKAEADKALNDHVSSQLEEVKKIDPTVNENALFQHAVKYGFRDLKAAHTNMKDMSDIVRKAQDTTVKNIQKQNDPVSINSNGTGTKPNPSNFASAAEYLRAIK